MKLLLILYGIFLSLFWLLTTFVLLASSHHVDKDFLFVDLFSFLIFPLTIVFLNKTLNQRSNNQFLTIYLLVLTLFIFIFHTRDVFRDFESISDLPSIAFFPLLGLCITIYFLLMVFKNLKFKA